MKKLVFLFAMVLAASVAMAQVDTTNVAETEQIGNQNDVLIKQVGDDNGADSHQYGDENDASVVQTGDDNYGMAEQLNGNQNSADLLQEGNSNEGYIIQGMIPGYWSGTTTYNQPSDDNDADMVQNGTSNTSQLYQWGNNNDGEVSQNGNNNRAVSYTGWAGWYATGPSARLSSNNSTTSIEQIQDGNYGGIWQEGGVNNEAHILQDGNDNGARISQGFHHVDYSYDFTYPVLNTRNNYASIDQIGNDNFGRVMQLGDGNSFKLNQTGDGNWVGYHPDESGAERRRNANFIQDGNNNEFAGVALNASNNPSFKAGWDAEQFNGATLSHESYQRGDYNDIGLRQGQDDMGLIQQDGLSNEALLWQQGADRNVGTIMQDGNNNTSQVVQIQQ